MIFGFAGKLLLIPDEFILLSSSNYDNEKNILNYNYDRDKSLIDIFGDNFSLYLERIKSIFPNGDVMVATQYDFSNGKVMKKRLNSF